MRLSSAARSTTVTSTLTERDPRTLLVIALSRLLAAFPLRKQRVVCLLLEMRFVLGLILVVICLAVRAATPASGPAEHLMAIARQADAVTIEFYSQSGKEEVTFTDVFWIERLAAALAFGSYQPEGHCLCVSYPMIRLLRKKEVIGTLSVHHGEKLRAYAGQVSGDFRVGAVTGKAIVDLANEKRKR